MPYISGKFIPPVKIKHDHWKIQLRVDVTGRFISTSNILTTSYFHQYPHIICHYPNNGQNIQSSAYTPRHPPVPHTLS